MNAPPITSRRAQIKAVLDGDPATMIRETLQDTIADACAALAHIAFDTTVPPATRLAAIDMIMTRTAGKPKNVVEKANKTIDLNAMHLNAIRAQATTVDTTGTPTSKLTK